MITSTGFDGHFSTCAPVALDQRLFVKRDQDGGSTSASGDAYNEKMVAAKVKGGEIYVDQYSERLMAQAWLRKPW
eukprot:SAG11_NODE_3069_length_2714_cov_2.084512_2_plen_75_part_00